ncbi:unnamed protein product [Plutella xylostella]|uniref:(diamondback moth) hypothetical protein n=1 Tax=Plutella xylostella TaxID=51655 RepID=A0A8S4EB14_PLUXY|nr:unnamed protein product [Plutella xylostella]
MSRLKCCVPGCDVVAGSGTLLHTFPDPKKNNELFEIWITRIGGDLNELNVDYVYKNRRVCRKHFVETYLYPKKLCPMAVPSRLLPRDVEDDRRRPLLIAEPISNMPLLHMDVPSTSQGYNMDTTEKPVAAGGRMKSQSRRRYKTMTENEKALLKLSSKLQARVRLLQKQKNATKHEIKIVKQMKKQDEFKTVFAGLSEGAQTFFAMQLSQTGKKLKGRRFTTKEKIFCLALYKRSPKAYRFLSTFCILPKRTTLQNLLRSVPLTTGINEKNIVELRKRVKKLPKRHRICALLFDEMALAPGVTYDRNRDEIIGFNDDGKKKEGVICDHALVFMVRGIIKKFKQPVSYTFCRSSTKTMSLKEQIKEIIGEIQKTGLRVVATVCDQGATNRAAINSLLEDTRTTCIKEDKEWSGGYFQLGNSKIYPIYDPPHLLKGIRNNLLTKDLIFEIDGEKGVAKWSHIEELYTRKPGFDGLRLVPKLTAEHVKPKFIPKMRVKHCAQVFSRTTSVALGFLAECGKLPDECKHTARLLRRFDDLFDSVNGSYHQVMNGKVYRAAVTPKSPHHALWRRSLKVLKSMKFCDKAGRTVSVPSV